MKTQLRCLLAVLAIVLFLAPGAAAKTVTNQVERSFAAIPGGSVILDVSFHDVEVQVQQGDQVTIEVELSVSGSSSRAENLLKELEPQFSVTGNTITMRSSHSSGFNFGFFNSTRKEGQVRVSMPPGMDLEVDLASGDCRVHGDLGQVRLVMDSASGDVSLDGAADTIVADTASGDVVLDLTRPAVTVRADTASGDVTVRGGAMELYADTASGNVWATGLSGGASFDTSSGDVKGVWEAVPVGVKVIADTASGDVRLRFPAGTVVGGFADTASGDIRSDFPGRQRDRGRHLEFDGGSGEVVVKADTASGDIEVVTD